jgi:YVTN family beta-propeller protein
MSAESQLPPPGWYSDPSGGGGQRYWDGRAWGPAASSPTAPKQPPSPRKPKRRRLFAALIVAIVAVAGFVVYNHFRHLRYDRASDFPAIPLPGLPTGIAVDSANHRIYVAWRDKDLPTYNGGLAILDGDTQQLLSNISLKTVPGVSLPVEPGGVVFNPADGAVFVLMMVHDPGGDARPAELTKIDVASAAAVQSIPVGIGNPGSDGLAIDPGTGTLYVANGDIAQKFGLRPDETNSVSVVDTRTLTIKATVPVDTAPSSVVVDPTTHVAYAASTLYKTDQQSWSNGTVTAIEPTSLTVTKTFTVGADPESLALDPAGRMLYVANNQDKSIGAIDLNSGLVTSLLTNIQSPQNLVFVPNSHFLYVCQIFATSVTMIDTTARQVVWTKKAANPACGAVDSVSGKVYIGDYAKGALLVTDSRIRE